MGRKQLRPSQYVTTYGSGSLVTLPNGHVVVPTVTSIVKDFKKIKSFNETNDNGLKGLDKFAIQDQKMEQILLNIFSNDEIQIKIFKLPTNADLQEPEVKELFKANPFPRWSVCYKHSDTPVLAKLQQLDRGAGIRCPFCAQEGKAPERGTPVRFIQACEDGHMDDIDWINGVHAGTQCKGDVFLWEETGSNSNFTVSCYGYFDNEFHRTSCGSSVNYFDLKRKSENNSLTCTGILQEGVEGRCNKNPKMILKNASNLRIPELISSVYIPKHPGQLYQSLFPFSQLLVHFYQKEFTRKEFLEFLNEQKRRFNIPLDVIGDVEVAPLEEIVEAINNIISEKENDDPDQTGLDYEDAINKEFESLLHASIEGFPPQKMGEPTGFHVEPTDSFTFHSDKFDLTFRATPIRQLFVTRVQVGYSREVVSRNEDEELQVQINRKGKLIYNYHDEGDIGSKVRWFIGNQLQGEGLFIQVCDPKNEDKHEDPLSGKESESLKSWNDLFEKYPENEKETRRKTNPRFVWWHSLSHKIINQLSIDSGFSSNSISERVYCRWNNSKNIFESGILLFTAQAGGDGTLGGLTSLAKQFERIFKNITAEIQTCSNDPVCYNRKRTALRLNGAACHACMLVSETSCELQNKFLDRNLLVEMMNDEAS